MLVWISERHRHQLKLSRFADRELIEVEDLARTSFPDCADLSDSLIFWWKRGASILRIDGRLLRKDDRFDGVLAPVDGFPTEDELVELGELVEEIASGSTAELESTPLDTFGECILFLAVKSRENNASRTNMMRDANR